MTVRELIDQLLAVEVDLGTEVLFGSWDGCTDLVGSVIVDRHDGKLYVIVAADAWQGNRT